MCPSIIQQCDRAKSGIPALDDSALPQNTPATPENGHREPIADLDEGLRSEPTKTVPVRFLYDTRGSELYECITQLEEYYPYEEEKRLLVAHSQDICAHLPAGGIVVELGCGDGSKTAVLLQALARRDGADAVHFLGIDVSGEALVQAQRNLRKLCPEIPETNLEFVEAEYLPGLARARALHPSANLCILWLGSSVGNFEMGAAAEFLGELRMAAGSRSALLLCTDLWKDPAVLHAAYDDSQGVTREFILNGMKHALSALYHPDAEWAMQLFDYSAVVNTERRQVEMWVRAKSDVKEVLPGVDIKANEKVLMEISRKFLLSDVRALAQASGLCVEATWASSKYAVQLLLPAVESFRRCWANTDALFEQFPEWSAQPIELRHPFGFYYGHVTAFSRLKLLPFHEASPLDEMLSRGIDPNVLDPSQCHSHPDVPAEWPTEAELREYTLQVRAELEYVLETEASSLDMHAVTMSLEHEMMHCETLCYMAAQQRKRQWEEALAAVSAGGPPPQTNSASNSADMSPFYLSRCSYRSAAVNMASKHNSTHSMAEVAGGEVCMGLDPARQHGFVWDNELGSRTERVGDFFIARSPVTVEEFRRFVLADGGKGYANEALWDAEDFAYFQGKGLTMPATWSVDANSGEIYVHMPEGSFPWAEVAQCPVYCSLAEAKAYCWHQGCRLMTEAEHQHVLRSGGEGSGAEELQGGGWEWTATPFAPFEGFAADPGYPEYSVDFFDGCHFVLRGWSPYTHPSLRRQSFRNYYQRQYPYVFAKFRVVKDKE